MYIYLYLYNNRKEREKEGSDTTLYIKSQTIKVGYGGVGQYSSPKLLGSVPES